MKISEYKLMLKRLLFAFALFPLSRFIFYIVNIDNFNFNFFDVLLAFLYGLRFDLSSVLIVNAVFIIASLFPLRFNFYKLILKIIFVLSNVGAFIVNIGDAEFFKFNGKKLTVDILGMQGDIKDQVLQLVFYYWYLTLLVLVVCGGIWLLYPTKLKKESEKKVKIYLTPFIALLALIITFIGIRGGVQMRSISPKQAYIFEEYELGNLAINSFYTLVRSLEKKTIPRINYFKNDLAAAEQIKKARGFYSGEIKGKNSNVVIIIVESLSQEYFEKGYTPFLDSLSKRSAYFSENFANGRRSIEALPSILVGLPSLIGEPIYQSQFQTNKFVSLPHILSKKGYDVSFFHGGKTGTMDFDAYTRSIGVNKYFGKEDYPNQEHYDGHWGIYDHYFFDYFSKYIDTVKKPFFTTFFTLSSHQPYSIPKELKGNFPKGSLEIHESIGYVDYSLKMFFEQNKNKAWFKDTLFIITADHTQKLESKDYNNLPGKYRVPLILHHPGMNLSNLSNSKVTQHADIVPSVLDFLDIVPTKQLLYGSSVFGKGNGRAFNYISGRYMLYTPPHFTVYDGLKATHYKYESAKKLIEIKAEPSNLLELKALIQYTNNGMKQNKLYY